MPTQPHTLHNYQTCYTTTSDAEFVLLSIKMEMGCRQSAAIFKTTWMAFLTLWRGALLLDKYHTIKDGLDAYTESTNFNRIRRTKWMRSPPIKLSSGRLHSSRITLLQIGGRGREWRRGWHSNHVYHQGWGCLLVVGNESWWGLEGAQF